MKSDPWLQKCALFIFYTVSALSSLIMCYFSLCPLYVQYRHSTPYVGAPQQYSVQPPGSGTFYPGPGPGEYPAPYRESLIQQTHIKHFSHTHITFIIWIHHTLAQIHTTSSLCDPKVGRPIFVLLNCVFLLFFPVLFFFPRRSPQVPPTCLTLCSCSGSHSWSTLLPRTDCVPPFTPHHSAYTTATSTSQAWEENSEYINSSFVFCWPKRLFPAAFWLCLTSSNDAFLFTCLIFCFHVSLKIKTWTFVYKTVSPQDSFSSCFGAFAHISQDDLRTSHPYWTESWAS